MIELRSKTDSAINVVNEQPIGYIEARYVRRCAKYFNCYLSSQTGCNRGCKFCHLTTTKQTMSVDVTRTQFQEQADEVFQRYREDIPAEYVHFSFMARGEPLCNKNLLDCGDDILLSLGRYAIQNNLYPKYNISTILPNSLNLALTDIFKLTTPTIYYSVYSCNDDFRRKWLPAAMPVQKAFELLSDYQHASKKLIKLHHAFIKDENDSIEDVRAIGDLVQKYQLQCEFNIVAYNPFSPDQGEESQNIPILISELKKFASNVKQISRVGFEVKASCGCFVE